MPVGPIFESTGVALERLQHWCVPGADTACQQHGSERFVLLCPQTRSRFAPTQKMVNFPDTVAATAKGSLERSRAIRVKGSPRSPQSACRGAGGFAAGRWRRRYSRHGGCCANFAPSAARAASRAPRPQGVPRRRRGVCLQCARGAARTARRRPDAPQGQRKAGTENENKIAAPGPCGGRAGPR